MRAAIVLVIASLAIPLAFLSPLLGLCAYCWLAYMRPQDLAWGIDHYTFGLYTAVALFLGLFARLRLAFFRRNAVTVLILALWAWWAVTTATAIDTAAAFRGLTQISTIFLICLVTTGLCTTKKSLSWVLAAIVGSLAFHGVKHGIFGITHGGEPLNWGIGGMMSGNNENAIAFCFALPILVYTGLDQKGWRRILSFGAAALTASAIVFSHSRAGFLAMVAAGLVMVWRTRARTVSLFVVAPVLVGLFLWLAPDAYMARVSNIYQAPQTDYSAIHRLQAWEVAANITVEHPITGIGPKNFVDHFQEFPHPWSMPRMEVHNTYLEYTSSSGLPGLALYLLLVIAAFRACGKVRRDADARRDDRLSWFVNMGRGIQASMVAFLVASVFGSLMHFDLMYHFCALAAALPVAYRHELDRLEALDLAGEFDDPGTPALSRYDRRPEIGRLAPQGLPDFAEIAAATADGSAAESGDEFEDHAPAEALAPEDDLLAILAEHAKRVAAARAGDGPVYAAESEADGPQSRPAPYALVEGDGPRWYRDPDLQGRPRPIIVRTDLRPDLGEQPPAGPDDTGPDLAPAAWYDELPDVDEADWKTMPFSTDALAFGEDRDSDTVEDTRGRLRLDELEELLAETVVPQTAADTWLGDVDDDWSDPLHDRETETAEVLGGRLDFDELDGLLGDPAGGSPVR